MNELTKELLNKYQSCKRISRGTDVCSGFGGYFDINGDESRRNQHSLVVGLAEDILEDKLVKFEKTTFKNIGYLIMGFYMVNPDTLDSMLNDAYQAGLRDSNNSDKSKEYQKLVGQEALKLSERIDADMLKRYKNDD